MEAAPSFNDLVAAATCSLEAAVAELAIGVVRVDGDAVIATRRLVDLAELACARTIGVFEEGRSFSDEGHVDLSAWLSAKTHARKSEGLTRRTHGKLLDLLPTFASALGSGHVGHGHLRILASAVTAERAGLAVTHERTLVESACKLSVH